MIYQYIIYIVSVALLVLIIVKTWLFFSSTTNKSLDKWFYFSHYTVYNSRSEKSRRSKLMQNRLTLVVAIVAVVDVILMLLFHNA